MVRGAQGRGRQPRFCDRPLQGIHVDLGQHGFRMVSQHPAAQQTHEFLSLGHQASVPTSRSVAWLLGPFEEMRDQDAQMLRERWPGQTNKRPPLQKATFCRALPKHFSGAGPRPSPLGRKLVNGRFPKPAHPPCPVQGPIAWPPRSPVRMRMQSSSGKTKILPSPI